MAVPPLLLETAEERLRWAQGKERQAERLTRRERDASRDYRCGCDGGDQPEADGNQRG